MTNLEQKESNSDLEKHQEESEAHIDSDPKTEISENLEEAPVDNVELESTEDIEETAEAEVTIEEPETVQEEVTDESVSTEEQEESDEDVSAGVEESTEALAQEEAEEAQEEGDESEEVSATEFYTAILEKAEEFVSQDDWGFISNELANLALRISEGPESSDDISKEKISAFNTLRDEFEEKKRAHYAELNKKKEENLVEKKAVLKQLSDLVTEQRWTDTKEVNQLKGKWENIKSLPQGELEALNERFEALLNEFESHKVDRLVRKLQQEEENFTLKLVILEKMDALNVKADASEVDYDELNTEFQDLLVQWRKIGRVPSEKNQQTWDHFNEAQDKFNTLRFKHDKQYRQSIERALEKKKKLIEEAEALMDDISIAEAARRVNRLHKAWKKTGNLPQKEENELWEKFKTATDSFNEKKTENLDALRDEEQKNLIAKQALIQRAIEAQSAETYDEGHKAMQQLMEQWKAIGPVPRKKSSRIWKQFKEAMDAFYDQRREHFKSIRKDQKDNLVAKKEIIAKLNALTEGDDPAKAVEEAKKLQEEFKRVGHVPLKFKNKIWKDYREVCDQIYGNFRSSGADLGMERRLASEGIEPGVRKEIIKYQKELESLRKDVSKLESEMIQYEEAQTYFKPTNKGNKLRDELQLKIDKAVEEVSIGKRRIAELVQNINELKEQS